MDLDHEDQLDPADADTLQDHTVAGRRHTTTSVDLPSQKGRLRLRPKVPVVEGYEGKAVSRDEVFGREDEDLQGYDRLQQRLNYDLDSVDDDLAGDGSAFGISGDLEKEYSKLMRSTEREMAVMRQPSTADIAAREENAKDLKRQIEMWGALVELRIHLEGALSVGHRLPTGIVAGLFDKADSRIVTQSGAAGGDVRKLLGALMALQEKMIHQECPSLSTDPSEEVNTVPSLEDKTWELADARLQAVLDWALNVADEWKEHTRLDSRRSFKMLDQSLRLQMQAVSDAEPEKLRKRCTPAPGKHAVFGKSLKASVEGEDVDTAGVAPEGVDVRLENIFDDRDFYVQLLREVLSGSAGGALSVQSAEERELYAEVQGRRAAKRKAKAEVERRASKGRKIRYRPIEKLQNFMTGRPRGTFNSQKILGLEDVEPLSQHACNAMLRSLFAPTKAS